MNPTLLVHGIWHDGRQMKRLAEALERAGAPLARTMDLLPNDGSAPIATLATQVEAQARALTRQTQAARIDLIGFSMGALVSRYFVQRLGGKELVRRFVSLSGPHAGTFHARLMPLDGARDMRPGSGLLRELASDPDPWGEVEVHTIWTPMDLMIMPPRSSRLPHAASDTQIRVGLHAFVPNDARVHARVIELLG